MAPTRRQFVKHSAAAVTVSTFPVVQANYPRRVWLLLASAVLLSQPAFGAEPSVVLVKNGQPQAAIILGQQPGETAQHAAEVLRNVVRQMTGAELTIACESELPDDVNVVLVGPSELARAKGIEVNQDFEEGDHYVIRTGANYVALVGNDGTRPFGAPGEAYKGLRGSVYASYDLLERLGCGWYGPDPVLHVVPKRKTLSVPALHVDERPAFLMRENFLVLQHQLLMDAWRLTGRRLQTRHALDGLLPREQYEKEHPDWYGKQQPCLTHPEVIKAITDRLRAALNHYPGWTMNLTISANDACGFCECQRCKAAGNNSARLLHFANAVARELAKTHPNRFRLGFLAYLCTHDPPDPLIQAEPGVHVMIVNEGDHTKPLDHPERPGIADQKFSDTRSGIVFCNTREVKAFQGWRKTGGLTGVYEWWLPGLSNLGDRMPWYSGETALRNLRYWKRGGIKYIFYATGREDTFPGGFPIRWPLYYVGARGMWNPDLTCEQIMGEACRKLYGPAAEHMLAFYRVLERAMFDKKTDGFHGGWFLWESGPNEVYTPEVEQAATRHIRAAAKTSDAPEILARIRQEQQMWNGARKLLAACRGLPFEEGTAD